MTTLKIPLHEWATLHYSPPPSAWVLRDWLLRGQIKARLVNGVRMIREDAVRNPRVGLKKDGQARPSRSGTVRVRFPTPQRDQFVTRGVSSAKDRHQRAMHRALTLGRLAGWADEGKILAVHEEARRLTLDTGIVHHVDHEIPLQGKLVSGLHVHNNLCVLTADQNRRKRNQFAIE